MILNLLEQQGLIGRIDGEYLQGGIGELPAAGLVRVMVTDQDYAAAKEIIDRWDAEQPVQTSPPVQKSTGNKFGTFVVGMVLGILCTYAYFRTPVTTHGIDHNRDGMLDDKWIYAPSGLLMKNEVDRNLDGKIDYISQYGRNGTIESAETDDDFDGVFESRTAYRLGNPHLIETDTDGDGYRDFRTNFQNGVIVSNEYIYPTTGLPEKIEYFQLGKLTYSEVDTDKDGKMDRRNNYNALGEAVSAEDLK